MCSKISIEFSVLRISLKDSKMTPRVVQGIMLNKVAIFFIGTKYVSPPCSGPSCNQDFKFSITLVKWWLINKVVALHQMSFEGSKTEKKFIEYRLALNPCFADQGKVEGLSRETDFYALQYQDKPHSLGESQITNFSSCIPCLQRSVLKEKYLRHQHPASLFPRMPNRKDRSFLAAGYLCCRIS